jgi:hypothetical protein
VTVEHKTCEDCPSDSTCDGSKAEKCDHTVAAPKYVLNNECKACPDGFTCDGSKAEKCDHTVAAPKYVLNNECTDCPDGHTCDGTTATEAGPKYATAAERAECLAGSEGSCAKCCTGINCQELTVSKGDYEYLYEIPLTEQDDCLLLKGNYNEIDGKGGNDAIVVKGDYNRLYGGKGEDALTVVEGSDNYLSGGDNNDKLTVESGSNNLLFGGAGTDTFYLPDETTKESKTDGKGNRANQGSTPLIVGLCVGAAVLVLVLAVVVRKLRGRASEETSTPQLDTEVQLEA